MTDHLEYIDNYFKKELTPEESGQFEQRITDDPAFAEEVAFYLSTRETLGAQLGAEKKERFRTIYVQKTPEVRMNPVRKIWPYIAAVAAVAVIVLGIYLFGSQKSPQELADNYIKENLFELEVTMDAGMDSIKAGKQFFKQGNLDSARIYFESILGRDSSSFEVTRYAGITCLRLKQYNKAIDYFSRMERVTGLYSNPGMFYHAVTLIERNQPGDKEKARKLLELVVSNNLDEKETAEKWLKNWKE